MRLVLGAQSMEVIGLSCCSVGISQEVRVILMKRSVQRTSESVSMWFQSLPWRA